MNGIYRYKNNQPVNWFHRSLSKSNQVCLYCGRLVGEGANIESNKEHLIGREFVPTGQFGDGDLFNFIFRSCKKCNDEKSSVERHISSITLFNSPARASSQTHNDLACRKAGKDYHPTKKGTLVKDSGDEFNVVTKFGPASVSFGMSGPPQADTRYIELLAYRHIQGIFSLITSRDPLSAEGTTLLRDKYFFLFGSYGHSDWGNPYLLEIMERARAIPCYANIETANGFFKAIMRRAKSDSGEWFWAIEWNKSLRVIGAIAQPDDTPALFSDLPHLDWNDLGVQDGVRTMMHKEIPLDTEQDILFVAQVENGDGGRPSSH